MRRLSIFLFAILLLPVLLFSQQFSAFNDYFIDKTMRIDYFHIGDAKEETITIDKIYQYGIWAGNPKNLIDRFNNGVYYIKIYDIASNNLIFSKGFNCMFGEYKTTDPGINGVKKTFEESALIPYPKRPILFVLEKRDRKNILHPIFIQKIDPKAVEIIKEEPRKSDRVYVALKNGDPHKKVDLAWIAEGYTAEEYETFRKDVDHYLKVFFSIEPYKSNKEKFNIYGVFRPSSESGIDQPRKGIFKNTALNGSFNAFNLERYLLVDDNKTLRDVASCVPYDAIEILVNSKRYGGGGIYNDYAVSTTHNNLSENVFLHEFGHSFAGLADEYYSSEVAYNDFYPKGVEPTEPNITALLNPDNLKWKDLVSPGISIPTEWGKEELDRLQMERRKNLKEMNREISQLKQRGVSEGKIKKTREKFNKKTREIDQKIKKIREKYSFLKDKVGAFEGAGYSSKGLYRPMLECLMFSNREKRFCKVCQRAILRMINFYATP